MNTLFPLFVLILIPRAFVPEVSLISTSPPMPIDNTSTLS
jgi:hypothetical protein